MMRECLCAGDVYKQWCGHCRSRLCERHKNSLLHAIGTLVNRDLRSYPVVAWPVDSHVQVAKVKIELDNHYGEGNWSHDLHVALLADGWGQQRPSQITAEIRRRAAIGTAGEKMRRILDAT